jgi:hypothetical protein
MVSDIMLGLRAVAFALLVLVLASGCGPAVSSVAGTITYDGKPVCSGTVMLLADGASPLYAQLKDDGTFTLPRVPVGKVRLTVTSPDPARPVLVKGDTEPHAKGPPDPRWFPLPTRYADPSQSGLEFNVTRQKNTWEIKLTD